MTRFAAARAARRFAGLGALAMLVAAWPLSRVVAQPEHQLPPAKQQIIDREEAARAYGRAHPAPKGDPVKERPTPGGQYEPPPPTGIIAEGQGPFSSSEMVVANQWQDIVDGHWVHVYAGALGTDREQGAVMVFVEGQGNSRWSGGRYSTPARAGQVWISAANGLRLTLSSKSGRTFTFDIASQSFLAP